MNMSRQVKLKGTQHPLVTTHMAVEQWEPDACCVVKEAFSGSGLETKLIALGKFSFQLAWKIQQD